MKPITKQLVIGVFILALVTVASLGIRRIRFSANRTRTVESPVIAETEPEHHPAESDTVVAEPEPQYANAPEPDEEVLPEDYSETKPSKGNYAKAKGSKGLEKISIGDNENLYITGEGELWYVSKQPDGTTTKMQMQEIDGELQPVGEVYSSGGGKGKSEGGKGK